MVWLTKEELWQWQIHSRSNILYTITAYTKHCYRYTQNTVYDGSKQHCVTAIASLLHMINQQFKLTWANSSAAKQWGVDGWNFNVWSRVSPVKVSDLVRPFDYSFPHVGNVHVVKRRCSVPTRDIQQLRYRPACNCNIMHFPLSLDKRDISLVWQQFWQMLLLQVIVTNVGSRGNQTTNCLQSNTAVYKQW